MHKVTRNYQLARYRIRGQCMEQELQALKEAGPHKRQLHGRHTPSRVRLGVHIGVHSTPPDS
jgi:hypothetical protein